MESAKTVRLDKWLWAVRVFKTRSQAAEASRGHKIEIGGHPVKPAREVHVGEVVIVRKDGITRTYKVLGLTEQRLSAALAKDHCEDLTPPEELERLKERMAAVPVFPKGWGRPTKKSRRELDALTQPPEQ